VDEAAVIRLPGNAPVYADPEAAVIIEDPVNGFINAPTSLLQHYAVLGSVCASEEFKAMNREARQFVLGAAMPDMAGALGWCLQQSGVVGAVPAAAQGSEQLLGKVQRFWGSCVSEAAPLCELSLIRGEFPQTAWRNLGLERPAGSRPNAWVLKGVLLNGARFDVRLLTNGGPKLGPAPIAVVRFGKVERLLWPG